MSLVLGLNCVYLSFGGYIMLKLFEAEVVYAARAGVSLASLSGFNPALYNMGLKAIPAAFVGGLQSVPGAFLEGIIIGEIEMLFTAYIW